jgi:hypothetical protein
MFKENVLDYRNVCHFASYSPDGGANTHETCTTLYSQVTSIYISLISAIYNANICYIKVVIAVWYSRAMQCWCATSLSKLSMRQQHTIYSETMEFIIIQPTVFYILCITILMIMLHAVKEEYERGTQTKISLFFFT